ncbi:MAG: hypothetical protein LBH38_02145 [Holosporales bacterium]|nr:hypothetical protein [Holosporales bacterium]
MDEVMMRLEEARPSVKVIYTASQPFANDNREPRSHQVKRIVNIGLGIGLVGGIVYLITWLIAP